MNKIVANKTIKRSILGHLILCALLSLSGTIRAATPTLTQEAYFNSKDGHKIATAAPFPLGQLLVPANGQCLYTTIIMGYLLPVRQDQDKVTARIGQLFGCPPAYYLNELYQTLQNPTHYLTYLYSNAFSTLVTAFMARMQIKRGTWGGPQEIQTIANKLNVNIQEYYPDPSNRMSLLWSDLTKPAHAAAAITLHIVRDKVHPAEVLTEEDKASAKDNPYYQHYRLKYTLPSPLSAPVLSNKQPSIPHKMGSQQKSQPYSVEWFKAAKIGSRKLLEELYHNYNININTKDQYGNKALLWSAYNGHVDCVEFLLQQGADINTRAKDGETALLLSAYRGRLGCVKYLLQQGAGIHDTNKSGNTALLYSAFTGHLDCVKFLVQQGAGIHNKNKQGNTALILSTYSGNLDCVKFLVQQGANVILKGEDSKTALEWAREKDQKDVVNYLSTLAKKEQPNKAVLQKWFETAKTGNRKLLEKLYHNYNINVNTKNTKENTALLLSADNGHLDCVKFLYQQGTGIHDKNENGNTALLLSAYGGYLDCVKFLVQQGAGIHDKNKYGNTALLYSAYNGHLDCVKYLLLQDADINTRAKNGDTALILSASKGYLGCVKYLIEQGARVTLKGEQNKTALEWAHAKGQEDVINYLSIVATKKQPDKAVRQKWFEVAKTGNRKLLAALYNNYNINVNARNEYSDTALHISAQEGHLDCVKLLLQQDASIHDRNENGDTALHLSAQEGHLDCLKFLRQQGAHINTKNKCRNSALILSAWEGHLDCVKFLLQQGARINTKNKCGNTALILSAWEGHLDCVKYLLQQGANIHHENKWGNTALQFAKAAGEHDVVNFLSHLPDNKDNMMDID